MTRRPRQGRRTAALTAAAVVVLTGASMSVPPVAAQPAEAEGDAAAGERVFRAHCAMCHGEDGGGMMGMHPSARGAVTRLSREGVEIAIRNGRRTEPPMAGWEGRLSDAEIDNVVAGASAATGWAASRVVTSPKRVVARRYAAGQVSRDEYLQQLADLRRATPSRHG